MTETNRLAPGDRLPSFCLPNQRGEQVCADSFAGTATILYIYPKDMTPGCTLEATEFNASVDELAALGWRVVGISPDTVASHARFAERHGLRFDILADPDRSVITALGAYGEKKSYGRTTEGVLRSTLLIDADGAVVDALYNVRATGHVERVLRQLRQRSALATGGER
ncbi:alkyl hydroperoxide reductase/ Thiol specific antioxidant/ Mal allergen [Acidimicrobium ferrooxidans DSM 10331]|uniref:thioredoxin-dependent peroxiredoxin n=1 Tax=Acidimicrobium ferrooxidans (strain DSM 10331 / JCM 15462 / NBRC 103882 / ICP) TaxID=525909 RepID=C7M2I7_ACIFD|nr:peroxiredoxin [Acidimicrobium ferrooxidans]ACU53231.1 alkyl hydroperoxide reductase/ Thiol specific antioxidant/ Mal allergen [Acidimicrobium ferrooxidans DSM 10331]